MKGKPVSVFQFQVMGGIAFQSLGHIEHQQSGASILTGADHLASGQIGVRKDLIVSF